jgi:hypothetical protein
MGEEKARLNKFVKKVEELKAQLRSQGTVIYDNGWEIVKYPSGQLYARNPKSRVMYKITPERLAKMEAGLEKLNATEENTEEETRPESNSDVPVVQ